MKTINNLLSSPVTLDYLRERQPRNFLGRVLFPAKPIDSLSFKYVKGSNNLPVMTKVTPFGSLAPIVDRKGIEMVQGKIPAIKAKINLDEEEYLQLIKFTNRGYDIPESVIRELYDDIGYTYDAVVNKIEYLRWQALTNGELDFVEDGYNYKVDYGMPNANKPTVSEDWGTENADILGDLTAWINTIVNNGGSRPTRAVTSNKVMEHMLADEKIRKAIHGVNSDKLLTINELNSFFTQRSLPAVTTYDLQVKLYNGTTTRFLNENKFILLPGDGIVGETLQAPTAEELLSAETARIVKSEDKVTVIQWEEKEPIALWTKAAAAQIPSMPFIDNVISATVITS